MVKIAKKKKILVGDEKIPLLMKHCECSKASVYNALAYVTNSLLAEKIRSAALELYGGESVKIPTKVR